MQTIPNPAELTLHVCLKPEGVQARYDKQIAIQWARHAFAAINGQSVVTTAPAQHTAGHARRLVHEQACWSCLAACCSHSSTLCLTLDSYDSHKTLQQLEIQVTAGSKARGDGPFSTRSRTHAVCLARRACAQCCDVRACRRRCSSVPGNTYVRCSWSGRRGDQNSLRSARGWHAQGTRKN